MLLYLNDLDSLETEVGSAPKIKILFSVVETVELIRRKGGFLPKNTQL
jgi:hypothetical protein